MKQLWRTIAVGEWRYLAFLTLALWALTGLPYLYGYLHAPAGYTYLGLNSLTPADNPVYYSYINQIVRGELTLRNLFTPEVQPDGLLNVFWLGVGLLAKIFHLSAPLAFHLVRLALIPALLLVSYLLIALVLEQKFERKLCAFFLCFASGLGAYAVIPLYSVDLTSKPGFWTPNDTWIPESITFLTMYKTPHILFSLILLLLLVLFIYFAVSQRRVGYAAAAGIVGLGYFNFHPFYFP